MDWEIMKLKKTYLYLVKYQSETEKSKKNNVDVSKLAQNGTTLQQNIGFIYNSFHTHKQKRGAASIQNIQNIMKK